ncbi:MAG: type II secretion system protein [Armatimonadota bacterium]|nr:type II secretion system protein [Armatimonadota bacterium]
MCRLYGPVKGLHSSRKGFTLVEVLLSLGVFVVLTLIFSASVPLAHRTAKLNGQYSQAISLCQHKIDQLRAIGYGRINYTELSDAQVIDESPSYSPFSFTEVDSVEEYLPDPVTRLSVQYGSGEITATATISWRSGTSTDKRSTVSLSAVITNVE